MATKAPELSQARDVTVYAFSLDELTRKNVLLVISRQDTADSQLVASIPLEIQSIFCNSVLKEKNIITHYNFIKIK